MAWVKNKETGLVSEIADSPELVKEHLLRRIERYPDEYELIEDEETDESNKE